MSTVTRPTNYLPVRPVVSETVGAIPDVADLLENELAVNIIDEQLYVKDSAGTLHLLISPRKYDIINADASFGASSFIRGKHELSVSLESNSVTATYDVGLPDGSIIEAGVHWANDPNELSLTIGDGTVEMFRDNREGVDPDGTSVIKIEGDAVFVKDGNFWSQIRGRCSCMPDPATATSLSVTGSVTDDNNHVYRIQFDEPTGGTAPYSSYSVTVNMLDANQNGRTIVFSGNDLAAAPTAINDSAGIITLTSTGVGVNDGTATVGGIVFTNGSTVNAFNGTLGLIELVASVGDLYGDINVVISVTDANSDTAGATL